MEVVNWAILAHAACSPNLSLSDYHFALMEHTAAEQPFISHQNIRKSSDNLFVRHDQQTSAKN